jgi:hypothetical protein
MGVLGKDAPALKCLAVATCTAGFRVKLDRQHQIAAATSRSCWRGCSLDRRGSARPGGPHPLIDQHAQSCPRHRAGERVVAEALAVLTGFQDPEHCVVRKDSRRRVKAAGQGFAERVTSASMHHAAPRAACQFGRARFRSRREYPTAENKGLRCVEATLSDASRGCGWRAKHACKEK